MPFLRTEEVISRFLHHFSRFRRRNARRERTRRCRRGAADWCTSRSGRGLPDFSCWNISGQAGLSSPRSHNCTFLSFRRRHPQFSLAALVERFSDLRLWGTIVPIKAPPPAPPAAVARSSLQRHRCPTLHVVTHGSSSSSSILGLSSRMRVVHKCPVK